MDSKQSSVDMVERTLIRWTRRSLVDMVEETQPSADQVERRQSITDQVDRTLYCRHGGGDCSPVSRRWRGDSPLLIRWTEGSLVDMVEETHPSTDQTVRRQSITDQVDRSRSCRQGGGDTAQ